MACVLLAAGRSARFEGSNKLNAAFRGVPLGLHAARVLASIGFAQCIAVAAPGAPEFSVFGFETIITDQPDAGQSYSLKIGIEALADSGVKACLVALADMPLVTATHIGRLIAAYAGQPIGSSLSGRPMPPAIFPQESFAALTELSGDQGARTLLTRAKLIESDTQTLADIDTFADWQRLSGHAA